MNIVKQFLVGIAVVTLSFVSRCGNLNPQPAGIRFQHKIIDNHPNTGRECCTDICAVGDLNNDGHPDVVIGAERAGLDGLVWYEYPEWQKHPVGSGEFTTDGQVVDMNRDGWNDIVVSNHGEGIFWYENPGKHKNKKWTPHQVNSLYGHDVVVGDIEGDGDLDIVTCDKKVVALSLQLPDNKWQVKPVFTGKGEGTALLDVDGDKDLDIIAGRRWLETPNDLLNDSWTVHFIDTTWANDTRVAVADMNKDGYSDVVLSVSEGVGRIAWFEHPQKLDVKCWVRHFVDEDINGPGNVAVADLDGDGDADICLTNGNVIWYENGLITGMEPAVATYNSFDLSGNHPNPFHSTTLITYKLNADREVNLKVFDINGKEVCTLINRKQACGEYTVEFDAETLPAGIYYYKLTAGKQAQTKKMILIK